MAEFPSMNTVHAPQICCMAKYLITKTLPKCLCQTKIVGSTTSVKIVKEGYEPFITSFSRDEEVDVGAVIGGFFVMVPFLWTMKYKPARTYELSPINESYQNPAFDNSNSTPTITSKAESLRELKGLLDDGIITLEEFESEKKKILEDNK